ncbi:restriction endonuclease subunit S [Pseudonocardia pini]|uniref:restriction endonuclease subunit S n=1 Tax=Pseudonocardia pini TaxID=2758030 RepID=UPI0015F0D5D9|nr:restriction endonuclease subunit S [Pseudonocardia pini]
MTTFLNRGVAPNYIDEGAVRVIGQAANQDSGLDWSRTRFHSPDGKGVDLQGLLIDGDSLINSTGTGTLGRVGYFEKGPDSRPCVADGHVTISRSNQAVLDSRFQYYWLASSAFNEYALSSLVVGATNQIELNRDRLASALILLPSLVEQRRVAAFLDVETRRVDSLLDLRSRQLKAGAARRRRAVEGLYEKQRSVTRIKYLLRSKPRYGVLVPQFVDEGVPLIRIGDLASLSGRVSELRRIPEALSQQYPRTVIQVDDVLVSVVGTLGRSIVASAELIGANVNRPLAILRVAKDVAPALLSAWMSTGMFADQAAMATASDSAQPTLGMEDLGNFTIAWPRSVDEQSAAVRELQEIDEEFATLSAALERQQLLLAERRRALITAAVTGQIDVSTARGVEA